jgi:hypothetical protein
MPPSAKLRCTLGQEAAIQSAIGVESSRSTVNYLQTIAELECHPKKRAQSPREIQPSALQLR